MALTLKVFLVVLFAMASFTGVCSMRQGRGEMNEREDEALERVKRMKEAMVGRDGDPAHHDKRRPIHDKLMDRLKKIKKLLRERGDDNRGDDNRGDDNRRDDEIVMEREDKGYDRYWEELVANNPDLAKRLREIPREVADKRGDEFAQHNNDIRSQIEELQRRNQEMVREALRNGGNPEINPFGHPRRVKDENNKHDDNKEEEKLKSKYQQIQNQLDRARHDQFKNYEMRLEHLRREKFKQMDEAHRLKEEEMRLKEEKERRKHEPLKHPASKEQLEDVWRNEDGIKDTKFDPKTFFHLHDTDGNGYLDIYEIEALFINEIRKIYGDRYDGAYGHEELSRMREHAMSEIDRDRDGVVSKEEFVRYTATGVFGVDEEWKPIEERKNEFTEDELKAFEDEYDDDDYIYDDDGNFIEHKKNDHQTPPPQDHAPPHEDRGPHEEQDHAPLPTDPTTPDHIKHAPPPADHAPPSDKAPPPADHAPPSDKAPPPADHAATPPSSDHQAVNMDGAKDFNGEQGHAVPNINQL